MVTRGTQQPPDTFAAGDLPGTVSVIVVHGEVLRGSRGSLTYEAATVLVYLDVEILLFRDTVGPLEIGIPRRGLRNFLPGSVTRGAPRSRIVPGTGDGAAAFTRAFSWCGFLSSSGHTNLRSKVSLYHDNPARTLCQGISTSRFFIFEMCLEEVERLVVFVAHCVSRYPFTAALCASTTRIHWGSSRMCVTVRNP